MEAVIFYGVNYSLVIVSEQHSLMDGLARTMTHPNRKKQRVNQSASIRNQQSKNSRLQPHLANIDKRTVNSQSIHCEDDNESRSMVSHMVPGALPSTPATKTISTISAGAGEQFNAFRLDEKSSHESTKQAIEHTVKNDIFRKMKFITSDAMMEFSMCHHSLCQYICATMHITGGRQGQFWALTKNIVKRMIEKQRTNATSGCKRAFQGE